MPDVKFLYFNPSPSNPFPKVPILLKGGWNIGARQKAQEEINRYLRGKLTRFDENMLKYIGYYLGDCEKITPPEKLS